MKYLKPDFRGIGRCSPIPEIQDVPHHPSQQEAPDPVLLR